MLTLNLSRKLSDETITADVAGKLLGDDSYDLLVTEDTDAYDAATGQLIFKFRKKILPAANVRQAWGALRDAASVTFNRGMAAGTVEPDELNNSAMFGHQAVSEGGSGVRLRVAKQDNTVSNTIYAKPVRSGIVGYFDRTTRNPYCRTTAYSLENPVRFRRAIPMFQDISHAFEELVPDRYAAQKAMIDKTSTDFYIPETVFTTVTVNKNWQTAVHTDRGDLKEGFGVLAAFRAGLRFDGCYFCFPAWRVAVDMDTRDLLFADVHQWHGNTPFHGAEGLYERLSLVLYYRENMAVCGSAADELERAKTRKAGDPIHVNLNKSGA